MKINSKNVVNVVSVGGILAISGAYIVWIMIESKRSKKVNKAELEYYKARRDREVINTFKDLVNKEQK